MGCGRVGDSVADPATRVASIVFGYFRRFWSLPLFLLAVGGCGSPHYWHAYWGVSDDGRRVVYSADDKIYLRDLATGNERWLADGSNPVFAGNGDEILYCTDNGDLGSFDIASGSERKVVGLPDGKAIRQLAYEPDGKRVFFAVVSTPGEGGRFHSWDIYSCRLDGSRLVRNTRSHYWMLRMGSQPFDKDRLWFAEEAPLEADRSSDYVARVAAMNLAPPNEVTYYRAPENPGGPVATGNGSFLLSGGRAGQYVLWNYDTRKGASAKLNVAPGLVDQPLVLPGTHSILYLRQTHGVLQACRLEPNGASSVIFERRESR